jgi:NAD(P)H-dependent FMN reductase
MKITAIMGSPHKGKGYQIIQSIEKELNQYSDVDFKYIFLSDIDFKLCKGCFSCFKNGEQTCPIKDDKNRIEEIILNSDGIILSSPGYTWNVSALMKNFLDRFAYSLHRPKFFNQKMLLVANGGSGVNEVLKSLSMTLGGSTIIGKFGIITTPWESTEKYNILIQNKTRKFANLLYQSIKSNTKISISLGNLIWFNIFKKMSSLSKETLPADYAYYHDKEKYFYKTNVNGIKSILAKLIAQIGVSTMKKQIVFY